MSPRQIRIQKDQQIIAKINTVLGEGSKKNVITDVEYVGNGMWAVK